MKKKSDKEKIQQEKSKEISRKEAIRKVGKYAAVSAVAMMVVLSPKKAQAFSVPEPGIGW